MNRARAPQRLSLCSREQKSQLLSPQAAGHMLHNTTSRCNEKPTHHNSRVAPAHRNYRKSRCAVARTQCSQKWINKQIFYMKDDGAVFWTCGRVWTEAVMQKTNLRAAWRAGKQGRDRQKTDMKWMTRQFSSVARSWPTLCDPTDCSTPGLPVRHQLPEFTQTHVPWVGDAIQPSHPLSSPSPPALNCPQHQGLFQRVSSSQQVVKVLEFQVQHQSFQWVFRTDFL